MKRGAPALPDDALSDSTPPRGGSRSLALTILSALLVLAVGGCIAREAPAATGTPHVFQPQGAATQATPTRGTLPDADLAATLRGLICWHDRTSGSLPGCDITGEPTLAALRRAGESGDRRLVVPLVEMLWLDLGWERPVREALERIPGQRYGTATEWYAAILRDPPPLPPGYVEWRGRLLAVIDPQFAGLLPSAGAVPAERLVWGQTDTTTPPLDPTKTVTRSDARYLAGTDVIFGVRLNGAATAYPERVLGWHQVARDTVGGVEVMVVACAPCGGVAAYRATASDGHTYRLAAAGLVLDGRRLLYDAESRSLWDPLAGRALTGAPASANVHLTPVPVVRTTWSEWAARSPQTRALDLDTGSLRDYVEGAATRNEPADRPAFPTGPLDGRLPPKTRVVAVVVNGQARAYPVDAVERAGLVQETVNGTTILLVSSGAGRGVAAFDAGGTRFDRVTGSGAGLEVVDRDGQRWFVEDERLLNARNGRTRDALPSATAWWFAWAGAWPESTLWKP